MAELQGDSKEYRVLIPCLTTFRDTIDKNSSNNFICSIIFEVASKIKSLSENNIKVYRTHPIAQALMDAFDDQWYQTQNRESRRALSLIYSATESPEFESQLSCQESTFEKAKIFSDSNDYSEFKEVNVISSDPNIESVRRIINSKDSSFNYNAITVLTPEDWIIRELKNKNSVVLDVLLEQLEKNEAKISELLKKAYGRNILR